MPRSIRLLAGTGNGLAAIQCFQSAHDAGGVFGERGITAPQMLHRSRAVLAMVDRRQQPGTQQLGELARVDGIALAARLQQGVLAGIAYHQLGYPPRQQIVEPGPSGCLLPRSHASYRVVHEKNRQWWRREWR